VRAARGGHDTQTGPAAPKATRAHLTLPAARVPVPPPIPAPHPAPRACCRRPGRSPRARPRGHPPAQPPRRRARPP